MKHDDILIRPCMDAQNVRVSFMLRKYFWRDVWSIWQFGLKTKKAYWVPPVECRDKIRQQSMLQLPFSQDRSSKRLRIVQVENRRLRPTSSGVSY